MLNSFEFTIGDDKDGSNVNAPANDVQVEIPINGNGVDDVTGGLFGGSSNSNVNTSNTSNSKCISVTVQADDPIANKVTETFIGSSDKPSTISHKLKNYPFALQSRDSRKDDDNNTDDSYDSNNTYDSNDTDEEPIEDEDNSVNIPNDEEWMDLVNSYNDDDIANSSSVPATSTVTDSDVKIDVLENTDTTPLWNNAAGPKSTSDFIKA